MRKIPVTLLALAFALAVTAAEEPLKLFATVAPVARLIGEVGGERVAARAAVPSGRSPHDYQPSPAELRAIAECDMYFLCDMWFEEQIILPVLERSGVASCGIGGEIPRRPLSGEDADHDAGGEVHHSGYDQHIWMSPGNAAILAGDIAAKLAELRPEYADEFRQRAEAVETEFAAVAAELEEALAPYQGRAFYVYHPAFGYFADACGLREVAIEAGGKSPTPRQLRQLAAAARAEGIRSIFVQPQYNQAPARAVAEAIGGKVAEIDPLDPDLAANFRRIGTALAEGFADE